MTHHTARVANLNTGRWLLLGTGVLGLALGLGLSQARAEAAHGHTPSKAASNVPETPPEEASKDTASAKGKPKGKSAEAGEEKITAPPVPMSSLRELLDQTIAEVRARQQTAPVVRISSPKAPARPAHGAPKTASKAAPTTHDTAHSDTAAHETHWDYIGEGAPDRWGSLKPENRLCSIGQRQSPIDIRDGIKVELENIQFDYRPTQFRVIDNGHTVQVNLEPGNSIMVSGRRYDLLQFHFHRPSEERINGRQFDMVAHLVHKDVQGRLAVVAVLMQQGLANPMVQLVWNSLPLEKGVEQYAPVMLDMSRMLPEKRDYYTYMGSLTTPPCSEGVLWLVMKQPAGMSPEQIGIFSRLYPMNARPIQPTGGRLIKESQ